MSLDYTDSQTLVYKVGVGGIAIANDTTNVATIGSPFNYKALYLITAIDVVPTLATQTIVLQKSDSAGSFASPTVLATHTITSGDSLYAIQTTRIADASSDVGPSPYKLRVVNVAGGTDATARITVYVVVTPLHC